MAAAKCRLLLCVVGLLVFGVPQLICAQDVDAPVTPNVGGTPEQAPVIVPPKLKQFAEPVYPPEELAQGKSGRVDVELVVGVDGHVSDPKIKNSGGPLFDAAALDAASRLSFEPATRNGQPIAARIVFPFVFEFKPPPPPPAEAPPPPPKLAKVEGKVLEAGTDKPIDGVEVILSSVERQLTRRTLTAPDGSFAFDQLPEGDYQVSLNKPQWSPQQSTETLLGGEATELVYRLTSLPDTEAFHAVARVPPPPREVTRRTIDKEQLTRIPGTRGDALRTVELLPGVARPPFGTGQIIVRGSAPADTQMLLEGTPVALLYHFGGLTSFINSRLLDSVDLYPGNFSVRYGRRRGGIVEATLSDPPRDQLHGVADINLIDGSLIVEGPITHNWEFAAAARRSWIDVTLGQALKASDVSTVAAPVYYDYQLLSTYRPDDHNKLRLLLYGSSDNFKLLFEQPSDQDPSLSGNFKLATQFHRAQFTWSSKISDRVDQDLELSAGIYDYVAGAGDAFDFSLKGWESYLRDEWRARVSDHVRLIAGLDAAMLPGTLSYVGPPLMSSEGDPSTSSGTTAVSNRSKTSADYSFTVVQPALYLESDLDLKPFRVVLGTRVDYYSEIQKFSFDPRLSAFYSITDALRFKVGVGMFSQPPEFQESSKVLGNPHLGVTHTVHTDAGFDYTPMQGLKFGVEGFYKHLYDRVIGSDLGVPPLFTNGGRGRIYGLEVSAKINPKGRFFGYLAYTLSRSERMDHNEGYHLFEYDQPHILTVSAVYRLGLGWEAGATYMFISGNPTTPIVASAYNKDTGLYSPIYGAPFSERTAFFSRLDVRVEKQWTFTTWKLALYLDVQNVFNSTNSEGVAYDYEYLHTQNVPSLPILPSLGLRGEL